MQFIIFQRRPSQDTGQLDMLLKRQFVKANL